MKNPTTTAGQPWRASRLLMDIINFVGINELSNKMRRSYNTEPDAISRSAPQRRHGFAGIARSFCWESDDYNVPPPVDGRKTLVLDMDETLIHSADFPPNPRIDFFMSGDPAFYVYKRPGLDTFLRRVKEQFETFVFTFGERAYAEPVLNQVCPFIDERHRLYRDMCITASGKVRKDLSIFQRSKKDLVLVDDSSSALKINPKNTIKITRWVGDPNDRALIDWLPQLLDQCAVAPDVRTCISDAKKHLC